MAILFFIFITTTYTYFIAYFTPTNCTALHLYLEPNYSAQQAAQASYIDSGFNTFFNPTIGETPKGVKY